MTNLVRREPFAVDDLFDDLMKGFFVRPLRYPTGELPAQIKMDVKEDDAAYTIHAEIPGVKKDDINVNVDGDTVSISAEVCRESGKEGEKWLHSERHYGKVYRSFTLGHDVDESGAKAKFDNGVLELTLPKKAVSATRRLAIE
jgi:HSP20 family protein